MIQRLFRDLESRGCEIVPASAHRETRAEEYDVLIPGLDAALPTVQVTWFWSRARIAVGRADGTMTWRWIYWTPGQSFLHLALTLLLAPEALAAGRAIESDPRRFWIAMSMLAASHLGLAAASWLEARRFRGHLESAGLSPVQPR